jgi:hypothetical protein
MYRENGGKTEVKKLQYAEVEVLSLPAYRGVEIQLTCDVLLPLGHKKKILEKTQKLAFRCIGRESLIQA